LNFNGEVGSSRMAYDPNHPNRILLEFFIWVSNGLNDPLFEIGDSADIVDDREICNIVKETVNRNVPAVSILLRGSKTIGPDEISSSVSTSSNSE